MRRQPDPNADPYAALGLEPGASMAEVKRAYRVLAKAFHPDSAGDSATPRFLAIQDAYERLRAGRAVASTGARTQRAPTPPPAEPWRADPARARAARERAKSARGGPSTGPSTGGGSASGRASGPPGSGSRSGTSGTASAGTRGGRRATRKATMGSTSYDEARDANDPTWSGASWYGPSSGEYWIVNPREYADPRKHGPDYQQRARRPAEVETDIPPIAEPATGDTAGRDAAAPDPARTQRRASTDGQHRATAWAQTSLGSRPGEAVREVPRDEGFGSASRAWIGGPADDPVRRLGLALIAWPPVGLAAAVAMGEVTGCTVYAAACTGAAPMLPWLAQAVILGVLLLLAPITRLLIGGSIAVLVALVPVTAFLVAVGGSETPQAAGVMAVLLAGAWVAGVGWSVAASWRRGASGAAS